MKIGLISYHKEPNYGTMLQAYALAMAIKNEGIYCEYVNHISFPTPKWRVLVKKIAIIIGFKRRVGFNFFYTKDFRSTIKAFNNFHNKYIPVSLKTYTNKNIHESNGDYDIFIVGSDQTWSPYMNRNNSNINFLEFVNEQNKKRSYAPSIGTTSISKEYLLFLTQKLSSFKFLSCRERSNCNLLKEVLRNDVKYVLDPTLLLSASEWDKIASSTLVPQKKYILAYILGEKKCISDFAEKLAKEKCLQLYYIVTRPCYLKKQNSIIGVSPADFIGLIRNASYVVTDSFHGSVFSINYGVNFYSFGKRESNKEEVVNDNDRILEFLGELELKNRFHEDNNFSFEEDIDYHSVQIILDKLRMKSKKYLQQILEE